MRQNHKQSSCGLHNTQRKTAAAQWKHKSNAHLNRRVCITSWASACNWEISQGESEESDDIVLYVGTCHLLDKTFMNVLVQLCLYKAVEM